MRLASPAVPPAGSAGTTGGLTAREREVLALIARGRRTRRSRAS